MSSQEGGTEYIVRQCVAHDRGSATHKATSCSRLLELGQNSSGKPRQLLVRSGFSSFLLLSSLCHGLAGLVHPLLPLSSQSALLISF